MRSFKKYALRRLRESILNEMIAPQGFNVMPGAAAMKFSDGTGPFVKNIRHIADRGYDLTIYFENNKKDNHTGQVRVILTGQENPKSNALSSYSAVWNEMKVRPLAVFTRNLESQRDFKSALSYLKSKRPNSLEKSSSQETKGVKGFIKNLFSHKK